MQRDDKAQSCADWATEEEEFVARILPQLKRTGSVNPEKQSNKYAVDLVVEGRLCDQARNRRISSDMSNAST